MNYLMRIMPLAGSELNTDGDLGNRTLVQMNSCASGWQQAAGS